ncbi:MAG TPA: M20 family metallo-hydrolase [Bacillota bacterium]|nr:M20 family metallo-hydrolase [Bacillota bacterium]
MDHLYVNMKRLKNTIDISSQIGTTSNGGLCRLALSKEDREMRDTFLEWLKEEGLVTRVDDFGNIYGRRRGKKKLSPVLIGSHLDTQPRGGRFDGILGVLASLEVIRTLNDHGIETERPIEIVNFTNEEGARFEPPLLGSGGLVKVFDRDYVYQRKDRVGKTFLEELNKIGYQGEESNRIQDIHSFIELHIEQGPILEHENISIGVVEGIKGMTWLEVQINGESGHAGPTPMSLRKDALICASQLILHAENKCKKYDHDLTITSGRISAIPNVVNSIADQVIFSLDVRHQDNEMRETFIQDIKTDFYDLAKESGLNIEMKEIWKVNSTIFNSNIVNLIEYISEKLGYSFKRMTSGAGHDAKYISRVAPTGMIFIPSVGGRSHIESELTLDRDIEKGAHVLLHSVLDLANS